MSTSACNSLRELTQISIGRLSQLLEIASFKIFIVTIVKELKHRIYRLAWREWQPAHLGNSVSGAFTPVPAKHRFPRAPGMRGSFEALIDSTASNLRCTEMLDTGFVVAVRVHPNDLRAWLGGLLVETSIRGGVARSPGGEWTSPACIGTQ